eukprot:1413732-Amphidinium_carterae.1
MDELALKISSTNATSASGKKPSVFRFSSSCSNACRDKGPNNSSGTEKRVSNRSKKLPAQRSDNLRAKRLFAVPGAPSKNKCSPERAARSNNFASTSLSMRPA